MHGTVVALLYILLYALGMTFCVLWFGLPDTVDSVMRDILLPCGMTVCVSVIAPTVFGYVVMVYRIISGRESTYDYDDDVTQDSDRYWDDETDSPAPIEDRQERYF